MKRTLIAILSGGILLASGLVGSVLAGDADFSKWLPPGGIDITVHDYVAKTTNYQGSVLKLNTAASNADKVRIWTDLKFKNGGAGVRYSPANEVFTRESGEIWLGSFTQYTAQKGDLIRLRASSGRWQGDRITGNWRYN